MESTNERISGQVDLLQTTDRQEHNGRADDDSGGNGNPQAPAEGTGGKTGMEIILDHFKDYYYPTFRNGTAIHSDRLGREVKMSEACAGAPSSLIGQLEQAADAPRDRKGRPERAAIPSFFRDWSRSAWMDLIAGLPEENEAAEISSSSREDFRQLVAAAMLSQQTLAHTIRRGQAEASQVERRSLIGWCQQFAKPGPWALIRGFHLWCRKSANGQLRIALRVGLFGQINAPCLRRMRERKFSELCVMYDVGVAGKACGQRTVQLSPAFIQELLEGPVNEPDEPESPFTVPAQEHHAPAPEHQAPAQEHQAPAPEHHAPGQEHQDVWEEGRE